MSVQHQEKEEGVQIDIEEKTDVPTTDNASDMSPDMSSVERQRLLEEEQIRAILENQDSDEELEEKYDLVEQTTETVDETVVGIDLGTTYSCVSIWKGDHVEVIADEKGRKTLPSVVSFSRNGMYIGVEARNQIEINPENTFHNAKRLIGRSWSDLEVQREIPYLSYRVDHDDERIRLESSWKRLYPEEVSALVLGRLKEMAERRLGHPVARAVITVPARFNDAQRSATQQAAQIAGLDCIRIINEPTAAALAYGMMKRDRTDMIVIVYDFGGGTLDVSMMRINLPKKVFQVLATSGNTHLGGEDFDNRLVEHCQDVFRKQYALEALDGLTTVSLQMLKRRCEMAKRSLSIVEQTKVMVSNFYDGKDLIVPVTRKQFEHLCKDLFILCMKSVDDIVRESRVDRSLISEIILVGGGTKMPKIVDNLRLYFGKEPNSSVDPDMVVSMGAAIQGYMLCNTSDPYSSTVQLLDVAPLTIGIEQTGGTMGQLIERGTLIPTKVTKRYTTDTDNMDSVNISIYEGERKFVKDNRLLGCFELSGLEPAPSGVPIIMVEIEIDANGVLDVTAFDKRDTTTQRKVRISGNKGRLSTDEIEKMVKDAREYRLTDKLNREISHLRYEIGDMCKTILKNVSDPECSLVAEDRENVKSDVMRVVEWLKEAMEKNVKDRDEYLKFSKKLKVHYASLILKRRKGDNSIGAMGQDIGTSVFNDSVDSGEGAQHDALTDDLCEEGATDEEKRKVFELRCHLIELYSGMGQAVSQKSLKISDADRKTILDVIEEVELWTHVVERATAADYELHIRELNANCNEIMEKYQRVYDVEETHFKPVEQLQMTCYALRGVLENQENIIPKAGKKALNIAIDEVLDWMHSAKDDGKELEPGACFEKLHALNTLSEYILGKGRSQVNTSGIIGPLANNPTTGPAIGEGGGPPPGIEHGALQEVLEL
jgi:molecular chaperone DnaK (HSP70)